MASEEQVWPRALGLVPGGVVTGEARPPGSKSVAQRAILCAALAEGSSELSGLPRAGGDVSAALALVRACGARVDELGPGGVRITGLGTLEPAGAVSPGESGTLARFALAALGLRGPVGVEVRVEPEGTLRSRTSQPLVSALQAAGVEFEFVGPENGFHARLRPSQVPAELCLVDPVSSQELSALMIACAAGDSEHRIQVRGPVPSAPYVEITRAVLEAFGASVRTDAPAAGLVTQVVCGPLRAVGELAVEPDASSAAVLLAAAALSGGEVRVPDLDASALQGDVAIVRHLAAFGIETSSAGGLRAQGAPEHGCELDLSGEPDLAPVLAAVAAAAAVRHGASTRLRGLGTLPGKESDRLAVLQRGLEAVGCRVEADSDSLRIAPAGPPPTTEIELDPAGDHRMAFAFALLGLVVPGVLVTSPACVAKSWPGFWAELETLGARVTRR